MTSRRKRIRVLSVRLTTVDATLLRKLARLRGVSVSELVRELVHAASDATAAPTVPSSPTREAAS